MCEIASQEFAPELLTVQIKCIQKDTKSNNSTATVAAAHFEEKATLLPLTNKVFTYVINLMSFKIRAIRRILAILTTLITRAFEFVVAPPYPLTQSCTSSDIVAMRTQENYFDSH
jgi:hypothetical protein